MNQELLTQATNIINAIGTKISQGAIYAWPILVKQQIINGISDLFVAIVLLILSLFLRSLVFKCIECLKKDIYGGGPFAGITFGSIGIITGVILFIVFSYLSIGHILNPEYYAIQDVISMIK